MMWRHNSEAASDRQLARFDGPFVMLATYMGATFASWRSWRGPGVTYHCRVLALVIHILNGHTGQLGSIDLPLLHIPF
jgi:hypothetical protein